MSSTGFGDHVNLREHVLSLMFLAFLLLKAAESVLGLESWPFSHASMFSGARPPSVFPHRVRLMATTGADVVEMHPLDFRLTRDEFEGALFPDRAVAARCQVLVDAWNSRQVEKSRRIRLARVVVEPIARPGIASVPESVAILCRSDDVPGLWDHR